MNKAIRIMSQIYTQTITEGLRMHTNGLGICQDFCANIKTDLTGARNTQMNLRKLAGCTITGRLEILIHSQMDLILFRIRLL
jgi:hypothetical protein